MGDAELLLLALMVALSALARLVGLQLHPILSELTGGSAAVLLGQAALVSVVVVAVRIAWQFTVPYLDRRPTQVIRRLGARERLVVGWSGMRGGGFAGGRVGAAVADGGRPGVPPAGPDRLCDLRRDPGHPGRA